MGKSLPVTDAIYFYVTVTAYNREDRWVAQTVETGLVTFGATRDEAENLNAQANVRLVRAWKQHGRAVLDGFMRKHGLVENPDGTSLSGSVRLAA